MRVFGPCQFKSHCYLNLVIIVEMGPVVRKVDSAIHWIVIFSNFIKLFMFI